MTHPASWWRGRARDETHDLDRQHWGNAATLVSDRAGFQARTSKCEAAEDTTGQAWAV